MKATPILFLDHAPAMGGAERSLLSILAGLDKKWWEPIFGGSAGQLFDAAQELGIPVHQIEYPRLRRSLRAFQRLIATSRSIVSLARSLSVELIYANTVRTAIYGSLAARISNLPFIWHMRDFWLSESRPARTGPDRLAKRWIGRPADRIVVNSAAVAGLVPFDGRKIVVYNGVDPDYFQPSITDREALRTRFDIPADRVVVGAAGRLRPWKGFDRFIRAAAEISRRDPSCHFLVAGGSPFGIRDGYAESLPALAESLGIAQKITFTGELADIRPALAVMDIFVHAGDPEPFGRVNIEAMAMELPIVAFAHGALPEIVVHGETGLLVSPVDETELAAAVIELASSRERRVRMGHAGRRRVESSFTEGRMVKEISTILEETIVRRSMR
jgi:glycosyltransferase involved in cell wall biosynthesis